MNIAHKPTSICGFDWQAVNRAGLTRLFWLSVGLGHGYILAAQFDQLQTGDIAKLLLAIGLSLLWYARAEWFWRSRNTSAWLTLTLLGLHSFGVCALLSLTALLLLVLCLAADQVEWNFSFHHEYAFRLCPAGTILDRDTEFRVTQYGRPHSGRAPPR